MSSSAGYVIVGAVIAAVASLLAVGLKALLDRQAERHRHQRELEKLRLEAELGRGLAVADRRQRVFARVLSETQQIYEEIRLTRRRRGPNPDDDVQYRSELRKVSAGSGQVAVEELRLVASDSTASRADALWHHLRSDEFPQGRAVSGPAWVAWKQSYWTLRGELVTACRTDLGLDPGSLGGSVGQATR